MVQSRWQAAGLHVAISAGIALLVTLFIVFIWYPGPFFDAAGGKLLLALLIGVDICLGPLVTLIIFNPRKARRLLLLDLSVIATLQLAALAYGVYASFEGRPVYVAYGQGQFVSVTANQIDSGMLQAASRTEYRSLPWLGPQWVGTRTPTDAKELSDLAFNQGVTGFGIHYQPQYYQALADSRVELLQAAKPLQDLRSKHPQAGQALDQAVAKLDRRPDTLRYLPLKTRQRMLTVLLDGQTGAVLDTLPIDPT